MPPTDEAAQIRQHLRDLLTVKEVADAGAVLYDQVERIWFDVLACQPTNLSHWIAKSSRGGLWEFPAFARLAPAGLVAGEARTPLADRWATVPADYDFLAALPTDANAGATYQRLRQAREQAPALAQAVIALLAALAT